MMEINLLTRKEGHFFNFVLKIECKLDIFQYFTLKIIQEYEYICYQAGVLGSSLNSYENWGVRGYLVVIF